MPWTRTGALHVALLLSLGACGGAEPHETTELSPADTADVQARTPTEIEQQAEPMTRERAEELGVVDTTIQVADEP